MDWTVMKMAGNILLSALFKAVFAFFAITPFFCGGGEIELHSPAPVFEKADVFSKILQVLPPGKYETSAPAVRCFSNRHPIAYYSDFAPLKEGGFVSADVTVTPEGTPRFLLSGFQWQTALCAVLISTLCVLTLLFFRNRKKGIVQENSLYESFSLIMIAVLIRQILMLLETAFWGNALPSAADEPGYFKVVYDLLHGSCAGPWNFTVGLGILYLPFVLLTGAKAYYDIAIAFSYFDALVLAPLAMGFFFFILKNLNFRSGTAFAAILIWALYPFFIYHAELWDQRIFRSFAALPCFLEGVSDWWRFYSVCINGGFNAMSDMPGLTLVLGTVLLAQKLKLTPWNTFFIGAAYGFCCLVRINYIFFAPALACICLEKIDLKEWKTLLKLTGCGAGGFFAIFGWQLLVNGYQFGDPLTFGYVLHYLDFPPEKRPDTGFNWYTLLEWQNLRFLAGANSFLMMAGIMGLGFLKDRTTRSLLTLLSVPLILFFLGYTHTYCDARRFIMMAFPVFIAAFCGGVRDVFSSVMSKSGKITLGIFLLLMLLLWFMPPEIYGICLCLLLLRTLFDLQQELFRGILIK